MNKKLLPAAVAAICVLGATNAMAGPPVKSKSQSLGDLSCTEHQLAEFDGTAWATSLSVAGYYVNLN